MDFGFTAEDVIQDGRCERKNIEEIKIWMKKFALPQATDEHIVLFLLSCRGDIEYTKRTIQSYFYYTHHGKNITNNRNIHSKELMKQATIVESVVIPKRTKDNYQVILQRLKDFSHWNFNLETSIKFLFMTLDMGLIDKQPPDGIVAIFDMTGISILHLTKLRVNPLKIFFHLLQEAMPCQTKAIHILNSAYFIDKLIAIIKPLMKKELYDKLYFHQPNMDMKEFFENYVEAECMPSDFGGKLPSVRDLSDTTLENMKKKSEWFAAEEKIRKNYKPPF